MKKWVDKKRHPREFQVEDLILGKMYAHTRLDGQHQGLLQRYEGPFHILKKVRHKLIDRIESTQTQKGR